MSSVCVVHASDAQVSDVVKTARDFARSAFPDVDESEWRARPPIPQSVVIADDVYQSLTLTVFEWGTD
jgi:hypothetical protein